MPGFARTPLSTPRSACASTRRSRPRWPAASPTGPRRAPRSRAYSSLDQFTRNCYRDSARAFAGDAQALAAATAAVDQEQDRELIPVERWFLYMPFVHAESPVAQARSLALFTRLAHETGLADPLVWAEKHAVIIRRFGRYPHRNALLGRASTRGGNRLSRHAGQQFLKPLATIAPWN